MVTQNFRFQGRFPSFHRLRQFGLLALFASSSALAAPASDSSDEAFNACVAGLKDKAIAAGVSRPVADDVLASVEHLDRVIELDRRQPEFTTTFADYLNRRVNPRRIEQGRLLLEEHQELLQRVTRETGVPPAYLLAFWGLETNFGSYFGRMSVPSALATLACDPRRSSFFTTQLIAALQIIDEGAIAAEQMEGSWAGAMGHVQFMPTVFLKHAVDADGDGRRDLWNSLPDAMMSAGQFLQSMGWDPDYRWGREVQLPEGFDYSLAGHGQRSLAQWRELGITDAFGQPLDDLELQAKLIVPAGHRGPAFLVYKNFRVIMGWNRSEYYAISVGHLADRIAGAGGLHNPPPTDTPALSRDIIKTLQQSLNRQGFSAGSADGILGPATRRAIRQFQARNGLTADGYPDQRLFQALELDGWTQ